MVPKNPVLAQSIDFALLVIDFVERELKPKHKYEMAKQLFRSGTSIGANVAEAQSAESKLDFIHKLKIAAKEAEETAYWLFLCKMSAHYPSAEDLQTALLSIQKLLGAIIRSAKQNL